VEAVSLEVPAAKAAEEDSIWKKIQSENFSLVGTSQNSPRRHLLFVQMELCLLQLSNSQYCW
jgi:hypothetical protein